MLRIIRRPWFWVVIGILVVGGIMIAARGKKAPELSTAQATKGNIVESVSETGSVVADLSISYGFEASGHVIAIEKKVGDQVKKDEVIARLDNAQQRARLQESYAGLSAAQAQLNLKLAGPSSEDRAKSLASVNQAKASLDQAKAQRDKTYATSDAAVQDAEKALEKAQNDLQMADGGENSAIVNDAYEDLVNTLKSAQTDLLDALHASDAILGIDNTLENDGFEDMLGIRDPGTKNRAHDSYMLAKSAIQQANVAVDPLTVMSVHADIDAAARIAQQAAGATQNHLSDASLVLTATFAGNALTQTKLDTLKTSIATEQTSINTAATAIVNGIQTVATARNSLVTYTIARQKAEQSLATAKRQRDADRAIADAQVAASEASVHQAQAAYDSFIAAPRVVDVASLRADVARQAANVQALQNEVNKTILRARADGVISKITLEIGETASPNTSVVTVISPDQKVEVDISESDVAKVSLNDPATMTLDAFDDTVEFTGHVVAIEPAETQISGVVYYKTTIIMDTKEGYEIRPGMTANISIETDRRDNVIMILSRAVITEDGKSYIRVLTDAKTGAYDKRDVVTGLRGSEGDMEIVSGISEGETVITFIKENVVSQ